LTTFSLVSFTWPIQTGNTTSGAHPAAAKGGIMHSRRFGLASGSTLLAVLASSACATGVDDTSAAEVGDAASDRRSTGEASLLPVESGSEPYDAWHSDVFGGYPDTGPGFFDSSSGHDGGAGGAETGGGGGTDAEGGVTATGLSVLYAVQDSSATSAYIGCELSVLNSGSTPVALSTLEVRYYYTDEVHLTPQVNLNWSHVSTSGADQPLTVTSTVGPLQPPSTNADTYLAFDFASSHSTLAPGESAVFSWQLQGPDPSKDIYTQTNDYSFEASATTLAPWNHVTLTQGGTLVWGALP
jgi:hypothetical protein